jgi:hypothetical protein
VGFDFFLRVTLLVCVCVCVCVCLTVGDRSRLTLKVFGRFDKHCSCHSLMMTLVMFIETMELQDSSAWLFFSRKPKLYIKLQSRKVTV